MAELRMLVNPCYDEFESVEKERESSSSTGPLLSCLGLNIGLSAKW